jgi:hypothetical protein
MIAIPPAWSTGYNASKAKFGYGFFEARIKIADIKGLDNAFWLTTDDDFEIDVTETFYPSNMHLGFQYWPRSKTEKHAGGGLGRELRREPVCGLPRRRPFVDADRHDLRGRRRTDRGGRHPRRGQGARHGASHHGARRLGGRQGSPTHPEGHGMAVRSLRIFRP